MQSEFLQLAAALGLLLIVAVSWLFIIYIPGRTMEKWEDPDVEPKSKPKLP